MACIIELKNICFSAQNRVLVQEVNHQFAEGKATAVIGPSGCGKSTVLKLSAALFPPSKGEVLFRGKNIFYMNRVETLAYRREAAVVFQDSALWANQSLFQILELPLRVHFPEMDKKERERRIETVVADVGYKKSLGVRPAQLSMGEQKLIAFARAMMCRPSLLYLDEWTESLDDNASHRLIAIVRKLRSEGVSIIFVSHDIRIIVDIADIVVMIAGGRVSQIIAKGQFESDAELSQYIEKGIAS